MTTQKNEIPIEDLISALINGNTEKFKDLVLRYQSYVYSLAFRLLNNCSDAEDVVQESFIRVWDNKNRYNKEIKFTTWLYRIVVNICYDRLKYRRRRAKLITNEAEIDEFSGTVNNPASELDQKELIRIIISLADELSKKQKMVFTLRDLQNLSIAEVADILDMSEESVKTNLVYARRALKEKIGKYYKQDLI